MNQHSNPKIRFREFFNKWNNYKLGQLGNFKSGIGFPDSQQGGAEGIPFFKVSDMNNIGNETEMRNANNYVTQEQIMKNSWKVINETPAIIFAKVGAALMLNRKRLVTRPFLIDNNTMSYSFDESWDKDFGLTLFQTINLPKYAQIGALPSYNASDIAMIKVNVPNVQEQSAIGSLFRTLDDLLLSYKDNLANYQSLKATMLSKMFPKAGQTIPELRLNGFEGEWEKLKLRDVVHTNPKSELPENFKYIDLESVVGTRINKIREERKESAPSRAQRLAKKGDIFYQTVRPYQKNNYLFKLDEIDYVFSTGYAQLRPIFKRCDSDFLLILLQNNRFLSKVLDRCTGTSYPAINVNDLIEILIAIPSYEEQQAIGAYFSNLDNLINSHQEKISQLETLKKKLLQDMFI